MSSKLSDYDYRLPEALIAKRPLPRRDESRMMVLRRDSEKIEHRQFQDLKTFLQSDDLLVLNNTRVLAARRFSDDHAVEFLFLEKAKVEEVVITELFLVFPVISATRNILIKC